MKHTLPPGPRYPSLLQVVGLWKRPRAFLETSRARYGKRFTFRFPLSPPFVVLSDPGEIEEVYKAPPDVLHPGEGARILEPVVGANSVILLDEAPHLEQRKLLLPAFHGERMQRLEGLMREVAEREVAAWPDPGPIALQERMQRLTLEIILRAVFGLDPGQRLDALRERLSALLAFGDNFLSVLPKPPAWTEGILRRVGPLVSFLELQAESDRLIFELIEERRAESVERDDVLTMLLAARHEDGTPMSDQELRDELMTLLAAGHETTASTLSWVFERLSRTPHAVRELQREADAGDDDAYLTATIYETLRRRPVLPNSEPRLTKEPFEVGGWSYPPGVCLVPSAYLVHHDPAIYPQPYEFRPERFLDEAPGTYTWIPFGGGRRRCVGASFAMVEMKIVLRAVLGARDLQAAETPFELAQTRNITVRPAGGARAVLSSRKHSRDPATA